ncbi:MULTISPECIES: TadE/TadG family type IV pilus assembly protein [unclassified Massilia]|uniref:TadE/TadG family type IV pilus assembly protein n=1 Tax=unclassified Massilia TaxID=2609279 RepID=UPI0009EA5B7E|nr:MULTISPECIES: TadE/TadG family type IV pilus assembly protein [unclassified Massilia]
MKRKLARLNYRWRTRERGAVALEAALLLPILILFLTFPIFYARCLWHYTAAQKAVQDAVRYLASVPKSEMLSPALADIAVNRAIEIATREIAELSPGGEIIPPQAYCNGGARCGYTIPIGSLPKTVTVEMGFFMTDPIFNIETWGQISINASVTLNYAGN